ERQAYDGEWWVDVFGEPRVVKADDRQVVRHRQPRVTRRGEGADRSKDAAHEDGGRPAVASQQLGQPAVSGLRHHTAVPEQIATHRDTCFTQRVLPTGLAISGTRVSTTEPKV